MNRAAPRYIIIKLSKIKDKERILRAARETKEVTYKGTPKGLLGGSRASKCLTLGLSSGLHLRVVSSSPELGSAWDMKPS